MPVQNYDDFIKYPSLLVAELKREVLSKISPEGSTIAELATATGRSQKDAEVAINHLSVERLVVGDATARFHRIQES